MPNKNSNNPLLFCCLISHSHRTSRDKKPNNSPSSKPISMELLSPEDLSIALSSNLCVFTMSELKTATRNFSNEIGSGGFGPVYKGFIDENIRPGIEPRTIAVKSLDADGTQGHKEWLAELIYLGQLRDPNIVELIGYCYEGEHRMVVYEYIEKGSLENHLFKSTINGTLPWMRRMEIAVGAAKGLTFLHEAEKPVIFRDFKPSNILLDSDYKAKLSDFGLAKDGPQGDETHVSTRVMGTYGYTASEYYETGHLTTKCDVYSFGVVLLELLTGKRSIDTSRRSRERNLVEYVRPLLKKPEKLHEIIDSSLDSQYSEKGAEIAARVAYRCLSENRGSRPPMREVVEELEPVLGFKDVPIGPFVWTIEEDENGEEKVRVEKPDQGRCDWRREKYAAVYAEEDDEFVWTGSYASSLKACRRSLRNNHERGA